MQRRNRVFLTLAVIAVVLIAARVALPYLIKDYVNETLHGLEAYDGSVDDIDLALWRGAYWIDGLRIEKRGTKASETSPFFSSDRIDLSVEWRSLVKGRLVAELAFVRPRLNLIQAESKAASQVGAEEDWREPLRKLFPFQFNTIEVRDGVVTLLAPGIKTQDALTAEHINGTLSNLTNVAETNEETFADFKFDGTVLDSAPARVDGSLDPWAEQATFDVNVEVKEVSLPKVNPWLLQYIKADAESGDFELYLEIAAAEGKFKGYAKPILRNVNITSSAEKESNPLQKLWEGIVEFAANILENDEKDQVAARVPFTGTIDDPKASIWATIASVVRNAFVSAFARSLEGSISLRDVKENLGKYSEDEKKDKKSDSDVEDKTNETKDDKDDSKARKGVGPRAS